MVPTFRQLLIFFLFFLITFRLAWGTEDLAFHNKIMPIPMDVKQTMQRYTWHEGCPVAINDLAYLQLSYWGFDNKIHQGILIVNEQLADEIVQIFHELFLIKFPIAKMQLLDAYQGDDEKSMADNNTVAFNCRALTSDSHFYSLHSYGRAIDINPLVNPFINNGFVLPPQGSAYLLRNPHIKGIIVKGNAAYKIFMKYGWRWGGDWQQLKDYQHFEKDN